MAHGVYFAWFHVSMCTRLTVYINFASADSCHAQGLPLRTTRSVTKDLWTNNLAQS